jgi:hypothetical protein
MSDDAPETLSPETFYMFKPALVGAPIEFLLHDDSLEWRGRVSGRVLLRDIRKVRLAFRPVTTENHRFITELWSSKPGKLSIVSTSASGVVRHERHNEHYTTFVRELHRRIAAAGGRVEYLSGSPSFLYWPGVVVFVGLCLGMAGLGWQVLQADNKLGLLLVGAMMAYFLFQTAAFFRRNLPGTYRPEALPPRVMP